MTKKKGVLLIIAMLVVLTLVSVLVVQKMKKDEVLVVNSNENVNENVNEIVKKEPEIIDGVDISDWKTYVNEELGVSFRYPSYYEDFVLAKKSGGIDREVSNGEFLSLYSPNTNISIVSYSKDYDAFIKPPYTGSNDLSSVCNNPLQVSKNYESVNSGVMGFCDNIVVSDQKTFIDTKLTYLPEGSGVYMSQSVYLNLNNSKYDALIISLHLESLTKDLDQYYIINNKELELKAEKYLNDIALNNLSNDLQNEINELKMIVSTLKLLK